MEKKTRGISIAITTLSKEEIVELLSAASGKKVNCKGNDYYFEENIQPVLKRKFWPFGK